MDIETRKLAYKIASTSCEVLGVIATGEKILSLVEAVLPLLEGGLTQRAPDAATPTHACDYSNSLHCPACGKSQF